MTGAVLTDGRLNAYKAVSFAYCENLPVKIMETGIEYSTLQDAYDAAASGYTIQSLAGILSEDPVFDLAKLVSINGGFECSYTDNTDRVTTLTGTMAISNGAVTIANFTLE
jgi:hypothetical protein